MGSATNRDTLIVKGLDTAETINASGVSVIISQAYLTLNGNGGADTITGSEFADIINGGAGADVMSGGNYDDTYIFNTGDVDVGESIFEASTGSGTDTVSVVTTTVFTDISAASFDEIEAITIAASQTATFTGAQLTGEAMTLTGQTITVESVIVNVSQGATFVSGLTSRTEIDSLSYVGNIGAETITGSALAETITGGQGNDLLTGGAGIDTYVFSDTTGTGNGIDSIVLSSLTANAAEDIFNFSAYTFVGTTSGSKVELKKIFADADVTQAVTDDATGQNILFLTGDYFASSTELASAVTLFADIDVGNVLILYAGSSTDSTRIALCSINEAGDVVTATDMAVLVGLTISNASSALSANNFILG
jgi:Ca2+-binding RTX toxin-like protein